MNHFLNVSILVLLLLGHAHVATAHGDLHMRIQELTLQIKQEPKNPDLYLQRAELFAQHHEPKKSNKDLKKCMRLGLNTTRVHLNLAKNYTTLEKSRKANDLLDQILAKNALYDQVLNVQALNLKGIVLSQQKKFATAADYFEKVIAQAQETRPENYLNASAAWEQANMTKQSKAILQKGIDDLGHLLVFHSKLVELSLQTQDWETAIAHQTQIIELSTRKERAYYERALIYLEQKQTQKAKLDLEQALLLIEKLPSRIKKTLASLELKNSIVKINQTL